MFSYHNIVGQFANQMLRLMPGQVPADFQDVLGKLYTYLHEHIDTTTIVKSKLSNLLNDFIAKNCSDWQINMNPDININVNIAKQEDIGMKIVTALESQS